MAECPNPVVAAVTLTLAGQPYSEIAMENELEFRMLAVDPAVQGNGVGRAVVRQVIEHTQSLPAISAISIRSATFMERADGLFEFLGFRRVPARDWYAPGEDVLLWVFRLELKELVLWGTPADQPAVGLPYHERTQREVPPQMT
ncbi:GNAT family N-acetyltransferase [Arthrobacter sp. NPDC056691]|uniref:GNAT family N-acetyltransferase n=1 Tax=Arthrobacter sp. NPDC056691 TaxID=3345913 RepID=UPI003670943E